MSHSSKLNPRPCPCGNGLDYGACCAPFHQYALPAPSPEALMRSRYSAFVLQQFAYLEATHHPDFRQGLTAEVLAQGTHPQWLALQVLHTEQQTDTGIVIFKAWFQQQGQLDAIYEKSRFRLENGQWFYTDGEQATVTLPKRNDRCFCGSGKKFKQCCSLRLSRH
ncbi:YchJ family protein [Shewanella sp. YIC-542]|uniref:YchJ family protein n=1 Tax=Shewanella mytili TaxID=3377111 RepID=UPI00398E9792